MPKRLQEPVAAALDKASEVAATDRRPEPDLLDAIRNRDFQKFLEILDADVKAATKRASEESHALDVDVADGRKSPKRD